MSSSEFKKSKICIRLVAYIDENKSIIETLANKITKLLEDEGFKISDIKAASRRYGGINLYIYADIPAKYISGRGEEKGVTFTNIDYEKVSIYATLLGLNVERKDKILNVDVDHLKALSRILPPELVYIDAYLHSEGEKKTLIDYIFDLVSSGSVKIDRSEIAYTLHSFLRREFNVNPIMIEVKGNITLTLNAPDIEKIRKSARECFKVLR